MSTMEEGCNYPYEKPWRSLHHPTLSHVTHAAMLPDEKAGLGGWWGGPQPLKVRRGLIFSRQQAHPPRTRTTSRPFSCNSTIPPPFSVTTITIALCLLSHPADCPLHCPG